MGSRNVVLALIAAINRRDPDAIGRLLTDDHRFIDSLGSEVRGRDAMIGGWRSYFSMVPDYAIAVERVLESDDTVVVLGIAAGTFARGGPLRPEDRWSTPAAWRAVVTGERIALWQVFADNEPIRRLMRGDDRA